MSLNIDTNAVIAVQLQGSDVWYDVRPGTFDIAAYEFREGDLSLLQGGVVAGIVSTGFLFNSADGKHTIMGPLTSIVAVKTKARKLHPSGT